MAKKCIQVYADEETKRRIRLAVARRNVAVTEYCLVPIKQQLAEDDLLEREQIEIPIKPPKDDNLITNLRVLREKILARRSGKPIDMDILEQVREKREHKLLDLG